MEGSVPAEVIRRDVHSCGNVIAVCSEQILPRPGVVITKPGGILPFQGEDVRPHISGAAIQLVHCFLQIRIFLITEQTVVAKALRPWPGGDVLHVAIRLLHRRPVFLQCPGDERRGICFGRLDFVIRILIQLLCIRKILHQFCDELLLLSCGWTVIWEQLHTLPRSNVSQIPTDRIAPTAFEVWAFDDQSCHSSSSSQASRTRCSSEMRPLVFFTLLTLSARRRCKSSSLN